MSSVARKLLQVQPSAADDTGDDDFANVVLLLDGDGTSGDANNTFTDSSTNGFTVTESGSVIQGSFSPYGDNWSNYFSGASTDYLSVSDAIDFDFGTGDFTVECFFYETGQTGSFTILGATDGTTNYFGYGSISSGGMSMYAGSAGTDIYSGSSSIPQSGQWNHLVWQRSSGRGQMYLNGTRVYDAVYSADFGSSASGFRVGRSAFYSNYYAEGYISNFRVVNGEAVYSGSTITVPTAPLTGGSYSNVNNLRLLTCHSNRFKDDGTDQLSVVVNGTPKVTPFSPFKDDDARTLTADGGSGYFDLADTAYLSFSGGEPSVADMTISGWVYPKTMAPQAGNAYPRVFAAGNFLIYVRDDDIRIYNGGEKVQAPINNNEWTYFAAQRSSNTWTLYVNGVSKGTASDSANIALNSTNYIGSNGASNYFTGYIADLRITTSGSTSTAVPTSPVSAVTNTELLLNFQDAGIYDRSGINNLDTVGNAQIDTAVTKYGTGSIEFDGNSDYLLGAENQANTLAISGAFTAECWFYQTASAGTGTSLHALIGQWNNATGNKAFVMGISSTSMILYVSNDGSTNNISGATGGTVNDNTWNHAALTWDGTNYRVFLNGTAVITQANSSAPFASNEAIQIGTSKAGSGGALVMFYEGYMDDIRITNGVARYTSSFTPPTDALPKF